MLWGGKIITGRNELIFPNGCLTAQRYLDSILQPTVRPFVKSVSKNFLLMHDNALPGVARIVTNWLTDKEMEVLLWLSQSSGLNTIEHVWGMLQKRITQHMGIITNVFSGL